MVYCAGMFTKIKQGVASIGTGVGSLLTRGDSFMFLLLGVIVFIGPLFFVPIPGFSLVASKGFFIFFIVFLGFLGYCVYTLRKGHIELPRQPLFLVLLFISLATLAASFFSASFRTAFWGYGFETSTWIFVTLIGILAFLGYRTIKSYERVSLVYGGIFGAFILLGILQLVRFIFGPATANMGVLLSNTATLIGTWGDWGVFLGLIVLLSVITLELAGLRKTFRWTIMVIGGVALLFLAFMNIRLIWVILGLVSLILSLYLFSFAYWDRETKSYHKEGRAPWYALTLFMVAVACIFFGGFFNALANRHQNITFNDVRPSVPITTRVVGKSLAHNFVIGYGPNAFAPIWALTKPPALSGTNFSNVDFSLGFGYVPTQIATNGILGAIGWIGLFIALLFVMVRVMVSGFEHSLDRYFIVSLGIAVAYLSMMAWVYVPGSYLLALLAILMGAFLGMASFRGKKPDIALSFIKDPRVSFFGILIITALIVITLLGGYIGTRKFISFVHYQRGLNLLAQNKLPAGSQELSVAASLAMHDIYHQQLANVALNQVGTLVKGATAANKDALSKQVEQAIGQALGHAQAAIKANPASYKNWLLLGDVYRFMLTLGVEDAFTRATEAYQEAAKRTPNDSTIKLYFAQLALAKKDTTGALALIKESIDEYPTKDAYVVRAQIQVSQQRFDDALVSMKTAVTLDPYNANLNYQYGLLLFSQRQYTNASVSFERAAILNRNLGVAYIYLGVSYEKMGKIEDANKIYAFIRKQVTDADTLINQVRGGSIETPAPQTTTDPQIPLNPAGTTPVKLPVTPAVKS